MTDDDLIQRAIAEAQKAADKRATAGEEAARAAQRDAAAHPGTIAAGFSAVFGPGHLDVLIQRNHAFVVTRDAHFEERWWSGGHGDGPLSGFFLIKFKCPYCSRWIRLDERVDSVERLGHLVTSAWVDGVSWRPVGFRAQLKQHSLLCEVRGKARHTTFL